MHQKLQLFLNKMCLICKISCRNKFLLYGIMTAWSKVVSIFVYFINALSTFVFLLWSSAERNNQIFVQLDYSFAVVIFECFKSNGIFVFVFKGSHSTTYFSGLFACFLLHNGFLFY